MTWQKSLTPMTEPQFLWWNQLKSSLSFSVPAVLSWGGRRRWVQVDLFSSSIGPSSITHRDARSPHFTLTSKLPCIGENPATLITLSIALKTHRSDLRPQSFRFRLWPPNNKCGSETEEQASLVLPLCALSRCPLRDSLWSAATHTAWRPPTGA